MADIHIFSQVTRIPQKNELSLIRQQLITRWPPTPMLEQPIAQPPTPTEAQRSATTVLRQLIFPWLSGETGPPAELFPGGALQQLPW